MYTGEFIIDALTESIIEVSTGRKMETMVLPVAHSDLKTVLKKNAWKFDWKKEFKIADNQLYLLKTVEQDNRIQGLISCIPQVGSNFIHMSLIENAPHNFGSGKQYSGVPGNLVAFVCKMSFELGWEGCVGFIAKTKLIEHYRRELGAEVLRGNRMQINTQNAMKLVNLYFKNYHV